MFQAKNVPQSTNKNVPVFQGRNVELLWNKSAVEEDQVLSTTLMMDLYQTLAEELGLKLTTNPRGRSLGMARGQLMLLSFLIAMAVEPDRGHPDLD